MQDLHLVGFTTDRRGLIFSTRAGSRSGGFVVPVTDELLDLVNELVEEAPGDARDAPDGGDEPADAPEEDRVESRLSVREIQSRIRTGERLADVARAAGVDEDWIERFAPPVRAEQRRVIERALDAHMERPRAGASVAPLRRAAALAMAERGIAFTVAGFEAAWSSRLVGSERWLVEFRYVHRGHSRTVAWEFDAGTSTLTARDRVASQLGFVTDQRGATAAGAETQGVIGDPDASPIDVVDDEGATTRIGPRAAKSPATKKRATKKRASKKRASTKRSRAAKKSTRAPVEHAPEKAGKSSKKAAKTPAKKKAAKSAEKSARPARKRSAKKKGGTTKTAPAKRSTKKRTPRKGTPKKGTPKKGTPKKGTPKKGAPKKGAPKKSPARKRAPKARAAPRPAPATNGRRDAGAGSPDGGAGGTTPPEAPTPGLRVHAPRAGDGNGAGSGNGDAAARVEARRARAAERTDPPVQFRSGAAAPVRSIPAPAEEGGDPVDPPAPREVQANGAARPRRRRQLRAR